MKEIKKYIMIYFILITQFSAFKTARIHSVSRGNLKEKTKILITFVYIWSRIWFGIILCGQIESFIHIRKVCVSGQSFFMWGFYPFDMNELSYKRTISQKLTISSKKKESAFFAKSSQEFSGHCCSYVWFSMYPIL